jgi:hypothetical protein
MPLQTTRSLHLWQFLTWLLLNASSHVQGYAISPGCKKFGLLVQKKGLWVVDEKNIRDLTPVIQEAMREAEDMAQKFNIKQKDKFDDSISELLPGMSAAQESKAEGMHATSNSSVILMLINVQNTLLRRLIQSNLCSKISTPNFKLALRKLLYTAKTGTSVQMMATIG